MSDHWNSLANLLGTPSLAPQKPKTEAAPAASVETGSTSSDLQPAVQDLASEEKPKAEKSRLKTSWDAVANFFGVAAKDAESSVESDIPEPRSSPAPVKSNNSGQKATPSKKEKPSMWEESVDDSDTPPAKSRRGETSAKERSDARSEAYAKPEMTRKDTSTTAEASDSDEEPQRRSHRRPPRRGQGADTRPAPTSARDESRPARDESRTTRDESRTTRDESRTTRDESRPARDESRPARRAETKPERSSPPRSQNPMPETGAMRKSSGFGAGIDRMDEPDEDHLDRRTAPSRSREERGARETETETSEDQEGRTRRRRRRGGRGRKRDDVKSSDSGDERSLDSEHDSGSERSSRDSGDEDATNDDAPSIRHTKIPSWNETISVLVEANMLNHQRSQSSQRGNPRGRGRR